MIDMAEPLEMFVRFTMELEVGFEVRLVVAQLTEIIASNDYGDLVLPRSRSVLG